MTSNIRADLLDASRATVRIRTAHGKQMGLGSGIIVGSNADAYYCLTNAHVVPGGSVQVEFFDGGVMRKTVSSAKIVSRDVQNDVAVVKIPISALEGYVPKIIPVDAAYTPKSGEIIGTIGHPHGEGPTAYMCEFIREGSLGMEFIPPPKQGRSGSAIFDKDFSRVIGLVFAMTEHGKDAQGRQICIGLAVPAKNFSKAIGASLVGGEVPGPLGKVDSRKVKYFTAYDELDDEIKARRELPEVELRSVVLPVEWWENYSGTGMCPGGTCPVPPASSSGPLRIENILPQEKIPILQPPGVVQKTETEVQENAQKGILLPGIRRQVTENTENIAAIIAFLEAQNENEYSYKISADTSRKKQGMKLFHHFRDDVTQKATDAVHEKMDMTIREVKDTISGELKYALETVNQKVGGTLDDVKQIFCEGVQSVVRAVLAVLYTCLGTILAGGVLYFYRKKKECKTSDEKVMETSGAKEG
ncbi:MAG: serine protease [Planctomycetia bacterium]|nr:serine protease [Planctomycetia bacterium]